MEYLVSIGEVGGDTEHNCSKKTATEALIFLSFHDHKGSSVEIIIKCNAEEGYNLLRLLEMDKQ